MRTGFAVALAAVLASAAAGAQEIRPDDQARLDQLEMAMGRALRQVLAGTEEFVSAQELHTALRDSGTPVGLATVYRTLADLVAAGEVDTVRNPAGETLYRQCGEPAHHHHLVCRVCGRTEEVTSPGFETWARRVAQDWRIVRKRPRCSKIAIFLATHPGERWTTRTINSNAD